MKNQLLQIGVYILIGIIIAVTFFRKCDREKIIKTVIKTETVTDTVYINVRDTVFITRKQIEHTFLRDTVFINSYKPVINQYSTQFPVLYGNINVKGEVLGEVLNMNVTTDLKIPTVTNTITHTVTNTVMKKSNGLYVKAGLNQALSPVAGGTFFRDKLLLDYTYDFNMRQHSVQIGRKIF